MVRTYTVLFAGSGLLTILCLALMQYFGYAFDYYFSWVVPGSVLFGCGCGAALASWRGKQQGSSESLTSGLHWLAVAALAGVCSLLALLYVPLGPVYVFLLLVAGVSMPYLAWAGGIRMLVAMDGGRGAWLMIAVAVGVVAGLLMAAAILDLTGGPLRTAWIVCAVLSVAVLICARRHSIVFSALAVLVVVGLVAYHVNNLQYSQPHWEAGSPYLAKPILGALSAGSNMSSRPLKWDRAVRVDLLTSLTKKNSYDWVISNGTAPVPLVSESQSLSWLQERFPLVAVPLLVGHVQRMLSVSPLPGPDVLIAKQLQIPVVNSFVYNALADLTNVEVPGDAEYPAFMSSGYLMGARPVAAVVDDGHYDLVFMQVTHPANAGWVGSSANESYLYTLEAMRDYWSRLKKGGLLAVTTRHELLFVRMVLTLWDSLEVQNSLHGRDFVKQVWGMRLVPLAPYKGSYQFLLMAIKGAGDGQVPQQIGSVVGQLPVEILFGRGEKAVRPYNLLEGSESYRVAAEKLTRLFSRSLQKHVDINPATDRRPYFFHVIRDAHPYMKWLLTSCLGILVLAWLFSLGDRRRPGLHDDAIHPPLPVMLGYFGLLGGLLVMAASLMVNLAGPWAMLSGSGGAVLIAAMIVGVGVSGAVFRKLSGNRAPLLLVLSIVLIYPLTGLGGEAGAGHYSILRVSMLTATSLLLGMSAGMAMLLGLRNTEAAGLGDLLPWAWFVAGVSALAGSVLAYWLSMLWGWLYVWGAAVAANMLVFAVGIWTKKWLPPLKDA